jgi:hypothetical protein
LTTADRLATVDLHVDEQDNKPRGTDGAGIPLPCGGPSLDLARERDGAAPLRVRRGGVSRARSYGHRHRGRIGVTCTRACGRTGLVCRLAARARPHGDDQDCERLRGDVAPSRLDRGQRRRRRRRGRDGGDDRTERRRRGGGAVRPPRGTAHGRPEGISRPADAAPATAGAGGGRHSAGTARACGACSGRSHAELDPGRRRRRRRRSPGAGGSSCARRARGRHSGGSCQARGSSDDPDAFSFRKPTSSPSHEGHGAEARRAACRARKSQAAPTSPEAESPTRAGESSTPDGRGPGCSGVDAGASARGSGGRDHSGQCPGSETAVGACRCRRACAPRCGAPPANRPGRPGGRS